MRRNHDIRGYTRAAGIQPNRMSKLHTGGLTLLVVAMVLAVCGLATMATAKTDQWLASTANQRTNLGNVSAETRSGILSNTPATPLHPLENPAASASNATLSQSSPANTCNSLRREQIANNYNRQLRAETARHRHVLRSIQSTGLVTRFFNPYISSTRIRHETAIHQNRISHIEQTYRANLVRAHCS
jgi:hypothetical protein